MVVSAELAQRISHLSEEQIELLLVFISGLEVGVKIGESRTQDDKEGVSTFAFAQGGC